MGDKVTGSSALKMSDFPLHSIHIEVLGRRCSFMYQMAHYVLLSGRNSMHERTQLGVRVQNPEGRRMKIALLCAMAFVALSSLPFASHHDDAIAQESTTAKTACYRATPLTASSAKERMSKLVTPSVKAGPALVIHAASASKSAQ